MYAYMRYYGTSSPSHAGCQADFDLMRPDPNEFDTINNLSKRLRLRYGNEGTPCVSCYKSSATSPYV